MTIQLALMILFGIDNLIVKRFFFSFDFGCQHKKIHMCNKIRRFLDQMSTLREILLLIYIRF